MKLFFSLHFDMNVEMGEILGSRTLIANITKRQRFYFSFVIQNLL